MAPSDAVRVLVCDDSAVLRAAITRLLESDPAIRVVARAGNGEQAVSEAGRQPIDVIVLDIEMPVMDGLTALPLLLRAAPRAKVLMASTLTTRGADITLRALRLGAADYVAKPTAIFVDSAEAFRRELLAKVRALGGRSGPLPGGQASGPLALRPRPASVLPPRVLAIGSSTGGPQALFTLIQGLGSRIAVPILITQHMPPAFTAILADHIARLGALPCAEGCDGEELKPGRIYIAPGDRHLLVGRSATGLVIQLSDSAPVNFCRPAVDPMLASAAGELDGRVLVAMLTGMGQDGLEGTRQVVARGGLAVAQDEASSVVWGMPGAVARAGLCHSVLPIGQMAPKLLELLRAPAR